jgi:hypothetical protein
MNHVSIADSARFEIVRPSLILPPAFDAEPSQLAPKGKFVIEHWRDGQRINEYHFPNGINNEGKNRMLDVMFGSAGTTTQISSWYCGLIDSVSYTALAATDTYLNLNQAGNGWVEFTNYTDGNNANSATTRPQWVPTAASGQSKSNSTVMVYNVTAAGTVKGIFACGGVAGANTKSDHTTGGVLWATALWNSGDAPVQNGDQLKGTYSITA